MRGLGSGHVTCGPMTGLEKIAWGGDKQTDRQTDGHCNSMTESAQWADSVKNTYHCVCWLLMFLAYRNGIVLSVKAWQLIYKHHLVKLI